MANKYDPNIKYSWSRETQFLLNGNEFGLILNIFKTVLSTPEAQKILLLNKANDEMENILQRNVESGNVKPAETPENTQAPMSVVDEEQETASTTKSKAKKDKK